MLTSTETQDAITLALIHQFIGGLLQAIGDVRHTGARSSLA
ncbi:MULTISPECIES: hypothetical protein [Achromobacter]|jgi:hypothetical protein|nr:MULTISPECIES: hypothetical protein [Achromobacter]